MSHALLGHVGDEHTARDEKELEAETSAWIVCRNLGLDTGQASFGYLASWSQGSERDEMIERSGKRACEIARQILKALES